MNPEALRVQSEPFTEKNVIDLFWSKMMPEAYWHAADVIIREEGVLTNPDTGFIYFYDVTKGIYEARGTARIKELITTKYQKFATKYAQSEIINHIRNRTLIEPSEWESRTPKNLIPVINGLLNIDTGELIEYNKNYWYTHQIPVRFDPKASCEKIQGFFRQIVVEDDVCRLLDICGLSIYMGHILEKFFILNGNGANGKTQFLKLLEKFIGGDNVSTVTLKQLSEDPFAEANTYNKLLNYGADIGNKPIHDTSKLKNHTGGETVNVQFKNKQHFNMKPTATFVFASNKPPIFMDDSDGMYRRPEIIDYPNKFGNRKDVEEDPDILLANPNILEEILDENELSGLFNLALLSLRAIRNTGELSVQKSTNQLRTQYLRISNSVHAFVNECCEPAEYHPAIKEGSSFIPAEGCISNEEFYKHYSVWCEKEGLSPEVPDWISRRLKSLSSWLIDVGQQDHYNYWGNKKKSVRNIRIKVQVNTPNTQSPEKTHHTHHSTIIGSTSHHNKSKRRFGVFGVFGDSNKPESVYQSFDPEGVPLVVTEEDIVVDKEE